MIKVTVAKPTKGKQNQLFEEIKSSLARQDAKHTHNEKWVKMTLYFSLECLIIKKYI